MRLVSRATPSRSTILRAHLVGMIRARSRDMSAMPMGRLNDPWLLARALVRWAERREGSDGFLAREAARARELAFEALLLDVELAWCKRPLHFARWKISWLR